MSPRLRGRRRWFVLGLVLAPAILFGSYQYLLYSRQQQLVSDIEGNSGMIMVQTSAFTQWLGEISQQGGGRDRAGAMVRLVGPTFDNGWVRDRDYLSGTPIRSLTLSKCAITGADLAQFVTSHPLRELRIAGVPLPADVFDGIAGSRQLRVLYVRGSPLTDVQFDRLPLEQFEQLYVELTQVTPEGLRQLHRCDHLSCLGIDGRQLTGETAEMLASVDTLTRLDLIGPEVTDECLAQLREMPQLAWLTLIDTAVTPGGVNAVRAAHPDWIVVVY
jgi:hypothetical protein